jgi:hypothetical protein
MTPRMDEDPVNNNRWSKSKEAIEQAINIQRNQARHQIKVKNKSAMGFTYESSTYWSVISIVWFLWLGNSNKRTIKKQHQSSNTVKTARIQCFGCGKLVSVNFWLAQTETWTEICISHQNKKKAKNVEVGVRVRPRGPSCRLWSVGRRSPC